VTGLQEGVRDIAPRDLDSGGSEWYGGWTASFTYDTRDLVALPTHGWLARINYFARTIRSAPKRKLIRGSKRWSRTRFPCGTTSSRSR
jgi:hypothetical protein